MEQDMRYIYQIYKDRSFSKAADHLYITQPALSVAVKRVEETIGAPLFDRSQRPLGLTEAGKVYIEAIKHISFLEDDLTRQITDMKELKKGSLTIGGTHYLNCYIFAPFLSAFMKRYPGVDVGVVETSAYQLIEKLNDREIDLTFSCDPEMIRHFDHTPLFEDRVLLAVHKDTPLDPSLSDYALTAEDILQRKHIDAPKAPLSAFQDLGFILLGKGNNLYTRSQQMFKEAGFTPKTVMTIAQLVTAFRFADNGIGATFICDRLIRSARSNLLFYPIDSQQTIRSFHLLISNRIYTPYAVRTFAKEVSEYMQSR